MKTLLLSLALILSSTFAFADTQKSPKEQVESAATNLLARIAADKGNGIDQNITYVSNLVTEHLVPVIDKERIARLTLGKTHWLGASPKQRTSFINAYQQLMIKTYAKAFAAFDGQEMLFSEPRYNKKRSKAIVRSQIQQSGSAPIIVDYRLYNNDGQWRVYDATVAGIGRVQTYRSQFSEQIERDGLDATIAALYASTAPINMAKANTTVKK
jgi:ABC-type transporter MlaC component